MNTIKSLAFLLILSGVSLCATSVRAAGVERVDFRLTAWKTLHFHDTKKAESYTQTFKRLGCECKKQSHGDHVDVSMRCLKWRSLNLQTHSEAHKWESFLKQAGFETRHKH